nr:HAD hydrolase family protein [Geomicrobium sp. JCM 19039]
MKTKAIFLDIDGTIYNEDKQMSDVTVSAVRALQEKGHHVLIATGRSPFMYTSLMEKLGIISHIV